MWTTKSAWVHEMVLTALVMSTLGGTAYAQRPITDDGVTLITQQSAERGGVSAGDAPGFPVTISESGSYRLGSDLIVPDGNTTAIDITVANVNLDLNGFSILSPGGGGANGVRTQIPPAAPAGNVTVKNGAVRGFGGAGLDLIRSCRVEGVIALFNGTGIRVSIGCAVVNSTANVNGTGISAGSGSTVIGNTVKNNSGVGMVLGVDAGYAHNVLTGNNSGGTQVTGGIQMGGNICGVALCP